MFAAALHSSTATNRDAATLVERFTVTSGGALISELLFSPDSTLLTYGTKDGTITLLEVKTASTLAAHKFTQKGVWGLAFHSDGKLLIARASDSYYFLSCTNTATPTSTSSKSRYTPHWRIEGKEGE